MSTIVSAPAPAPSADEQPKQEVAKAVVAPKRRYFVPHLGKSISGNFASPQEAADELEKQLKTKKAGDGK